MASNYGVSLVHYDYRNVSKGPAPANCGSMEVVGLNGDVRRISLDRYMLDHSSFARRHAQECATVRLSGGQNYGDRFLEVFHFDQPAVEPLPRTRTS
jgi:hypothetical protein